MKTNLFLTVLLLLAGLTSAHAEVIQIGSGSVTDTSLPTNVYYRYSVSQQIYTAEELGAAGTIKSIAFYNNGTFSSSRNLYIYFVATDMDGFYSQADWISFSSADEVFGEFVNFMPKAWTTITLQNPFEYDGKKNLAVIVTDDTGGYEEEELPFLTFASSNGALLVHNDNSAYNSSTIGNNLGTKPDVRNQIKLDIDRPKVIDRIEIYGFTQPVWGAVPDNDVSVPSDANYTVSANWYWYKKDFSEVGVIPNTFDNDELLYGQTFRITPNEGFSFTEDVSVTINGQTDIISSKNLYADEFRVRTIYYSVTPPEPLVLYADGDNSELIYDYRDKVCDVTLQGLTLLKDGTWQTICLPFDVTLKGSVLEGAEVCTVNNYQVQKIQGVSCLIALCGARLSALKAGTPYFIRWKSGEDITDPVFPGVTIKSYHNAFLMADIGFHGIYYSLSQSDVADYPPDEGVYYLEGGGPILKKFSDDTETELRAFSCIFDVFSFSVYADESKAGFGVLFPGERLSDLVTGIDSPATQPEEGPIYNLAGQRLQKMQRGVNIIAGKKVLVK